MSMESDFLKEHEAFLTILEQERATNELTDYFSQQIKKTYQTDDIALAWKKYKQDHGI